MTVIDIVGGLAALCVLATFCMRSMLALRGFAIASNLLFIFYGLKANLLPIVILHAVLLPINSWWLGLLCGRRGAATAFGLASALVAMTVLLSFFEPTVASFVSRCLRQLMSWPCLEPSHLCLNGLRTTKA